MKKYAICFHLLLLSPSITCAQGWRGVEPLHSTREEVARILGPTAPGMRDHYELDQESVFILYSDGECGQRGNIGWNVPAGTVVEIRVTPKTRLRLSDFGVDKSRYRKEEIKQSGHTFYTDFEKGVSYSVSGEEEAIRMIFYMPTVSQEHLRCAGALASQAQREADRERYLADLGGKQETLPYRLLDQYSGFGNPDEKAHLINFSYLLKEHPGVLGYVVVYGGRHSCAGEARSYAVRVKSYLVKMRGIKAERIVTIDGGHRQELTVELYLVPRGAPAPIPSPSVPASEVQISKGDCVKKYNRRSSHPRHRSTRRAGR